MPIKVRCKECDASFSVKDEAAGKRVRCKGCGAPVRVSAGKPKKKRRPTSDAADTDDFLASFDIDKIEDQESKICPRCGYDVDEEDTECANCGVDLSTGRLSEATRRKRKRKGPTVEEFYSKSWGDAYRFLGAHKGLAVKTAIYSAISSTLFFFSIFMMFWCHRTPPSAFWGFIAFVSIMSIPGWIWFIQTEVVRYALLKKDKLKRINFDFFLCSALGIKFIFWVFLFSLPAQAIFGSLGMYFIMNGSVPVGASLIAAGFIPTFLMFPLAIPHMTVADPSPGWMPHKLGKVFITLFKPAIFWCFVFVVTNLPAFGCVAAIGAVYGQSIDKFFSNVGYNSAIARDDAAKEYAEENKIQDFEEGPLTGKTPVELDPSVLIVPSILWLVACGFYAPAMIYNARVNGLLAVHSKPDLGLITKVEETKYVPKAKKDQGEPVANRGALAGTAILIGGILGGGLYFLAPMMPLMLSIILLIICGLTSVGCFITALVKIGQNDGAGHCILGFFISIYAYSKGWAYAEYDKNMGPLMVTWTITLIVGNLLSLGLDNHEFFKELPDEEPAAEAGP